MRRSLACATARLNSTRQVKSVKGLRSGFNGFEPPIVKLSRARKGCALTKAYAFLVIISRKILSSNCLAYAQIRRISVIHGLFGADNKLRTNS